MYKTGQFEWYLLTTPLKFKELSADPANSAVPANTVSLYAKDKSGTSDLYFKDDAGVVHDLGLLPETAQALTRTNDTNVTLTLGGSPATALLAATSLTLGWTGQLAVSRGGTGVGTLGNLTKVDDTNVTLTLGGTPTGALITSTSLTLGWTGQLSIARGGTGQSTALAAFNALSPLTTRGDLLTRDASNNVRLAVGGANTLLKSNGTDPSWLDYTTDWLSQYALLAGRSGGQTLKGGTASGDTLTLNGTSNVSGGGVFLNDVALTNNSANFINSGIRTTLNGSGDQPFFFELAGQLAPSGDVATLIGFYNGLAFAPVGNVTGNCYASLFNPSFSPPTGKTIASGSALDFTCVTGSTGGAITTLRGVHAAMNYGSIKPTTSIGFDIANVGSTGITTAIGLNIDKPTSATNNFYMSFDTADATAAGTYFGRIPVRYAGALKYIHIFNA